jgi:hypothetical protein
MEIVDDVAGLKPKKKYGGAFAYVSPAEAPPR